MPFLMRSQRADLYKVLEENELDPGDFEIVPSTAKALSHERGEQVRLKGTDYYFSIYPNESEFQREKFFVEFSPGKEEIHELDLCHNWDFVCYKFVEYLSFLQRETNTRDPWSEAREFSDSLGSLPETSLPNEPISPSERGAIFKALERIETTLLNHVQQSATKEQFVKAQFKVLHDAVTKFGRKDFLMLLYTAVIGVGTTVGVPPDIGMQILETLRQLSGHVPKLTP